MHVDNYEPDPLVFDAHREVTHERSTMHLRCRPFGHPVLDVTERYSTFLALRFAQGVRRTEFGARGHELKVVLHV